MSGMTCLKCDMDDPVACVWVGEYGCLRGWADALVRREATDAEIARLRDQVRRLRDSLERIASRAERIVSGEITTEIMGSADYDLMVALPALAEATVFILGENRKRAHDRSSQS